MGGGGARGGGGGGGGGGGQLASALADYGSAKKEQNFRQKACSSTNLPQTFTCF